MTCPLVETPEPTEHHEIAVFAMGASIAAIHRAVLICFRMILGA